MIRRRVLIEALRAETAAIDYFATLTPRERRAYVLSHPRSLMAMAGASWFSKMSGDRQAEYVRAHPHSIYATGDSRASSDHAPMMRRHLQRVAYHKRMATESGEGKRGPHTKAAELHQVAANHHFSGTKNPERGGSGAHQWTHDADRASWEIDHPRDGTARTPAETPPKRGSAEPRIPRGTDATKTHRHLTEHYGAKFQNEHNRGYHEIHSTVSHDDSERLHAKLRDQGWAHTKTGDHTHMYRHMGHGGYIRRLSPSGSDRTNTWAVHGAVKPDPGRR